MPSLGLLLILASNPEGQKFSFPLVNLSCSFGSAAATAAALAASFLVCVEAVLVGVQVDVELGEALTFGSD